MFLLSRFVHEQGIKVVCTGKVRTRSSAATTSSARPWSGNSSCAGLSSPRRAQLFERLYPQIFRTPREKASFRQFMATARRIRRIRCSPISCDGTTRPASSSSSRRSCGRRSAGYSATEDLARTLPPDFERRDTAVQGPVPGGQALPEQLSPDVPGRPDGHGPLPWRSGRLTSISGSSISCRASRPPWKILGLDEKHILKKAFRDVLPASITRRTKHPYRAPIQKRFRRTAPIRRLSATRFRSGGIRDAGIFDPPIRSAGSSASSIPARARAKRKEWPSPGSFPRSCWSNRHSGDARARMRRRTAWDVHFDRTAASDR